MGCRRIKKMVSPYIDDGLTAADRETFLQHIGKCRKCSRELTQAQEVHKLFTQAERSPAPYGFTARVMANLEHKRLPGKYLRDIFTFRPLFPCLAKTAFALAVMTLGIIAGSRLIPYQTGIQEQAGTEQAFSLDVFQAAPPDSIGGAYAGIMGEGNEG